MKSPRVLRCQGWPTSHPALHVHTLGAETHPLWQDTPAKEGTVRERAVWKCEG